MKSATPRTDEWEIEIQGDMVVYSENCATLEEELAAAKADCVTMAFRLMGEPLESMAPETAEAFQRYKPLCEKLLRGEEIAP